MEEREGNYIKEGRGGDGEMGGGCPGIPLPAGAVSHTSVPENLSVSFITIFSVLLRLMSFMFLRRDWLSSMSMIRIRGMVPPPRRRMVKSTMMMVVVPISWRFSMGSRPR